MVTWLARWTSDLEVGGSSLVSVVFVVFLGKKLYSTLSLFIQVYKWIPAIIMQWGNLAMDWHPIQGGSSNIPSCFMLQKPELSARLMGLLARMQTLPTLLIFLCRFMVF